MPQPRYRVLTANARCARRIVEQAQPRLRYKEGVSSSKFVLTMSEPAVAVVVAGVDAHARLGAAVGGQCDARLQADRP